MNYSATTTPNIRNSIDGKSFKHAREFLNGTAQSTKATNIISDARSAANANNASSEYSFYDRGYKEYEYNPLKKRRTRPRTAGVHGRNSKAKE